MGHMIFLNIHFDMDVKLKKCVTISTNHKGSSFMNMERSQINQ